MFDLSGQTALVTGASGGIGGAIAKTLHRQGAEVMLAGTRSAALEALAGELGERVHIGLADFADPAAPERLAKEAEAAMGRVDILVNNAGITRDALALRMNDEDWQAVLEVNLTAQLSGSPARSCAAWFGGGTAALSGSPRSSAVSGNAGQANYAAAKAAMIGMSKSIAAEVAGRGITVNCVAPGSDHDGDDRQVDRRSSARGLPKRFPPAGSAPRTRSQRPSSTWRVPRRLMSPARPCTSMAAWSWYEPRRSRSLARPICTAGETCYVTAP